MGLRDFTGAVNTKLSATLTLLALTVPAFRFGLDELNQEDSPPRICWVPKRGPTDGGIMPAADAPPNYGVPYAPGAGVVIRPLWRRRLLMEAHVWALRADDKNDLDRSKDYAAAEALANHLVAAVHTVAFGSYQAVSEDWTTAAGSAQRLGAVCVVGFDVYFPWVRETDTLGLVTAMPIVVGTEHG